MSCLLVGMLLKLNLDRIEIGISLTLPVEVSRLKLNLDRIEIRPLNSLEKHRTVKIEP